MYKVLITDRRWFAVVSAAAEDFWAKKMYYYTGNFTYNALLAVIALVVALSALIGLLATSQGFGDRAAGAFKSLVPIFGSSESRTVEILKSYKSVVGIIGIVGLMWTGTKIFRAMEWGFSEIWGSKRRGYAKGRLLGLLLISVIGVLFLLAFLVQFGFAALWSWIAGSSGTVHDLGLVLAQPLVAFGVNFGLFLFVYRFVPTVPQRLRTVMVGAAASAVVYLAMQYGVAWYFGSVSSMPAVYGSLFTVIILIMWLHFTGIVLFFGAEIIYVGHNQELVDQHLERARNWSFIPGFLKPRESPDEPGDDARTTPGPGRES